MKILVISTSLSDDSLSRNAAKKLVEILPQYGVSVSYESLENFPAVWVNNGDLEDFGMEYEALFKQIEDSDGVVFAFPVYNYTMGSPMKVLSEIVGDALEHKPVSFIVAAGSLRSHLAVGDIMLSMIFEQETLCFPKFVMVNKENFDDRLNPDKETEKRLLELGESFTAFTKRNS